MRFLRQAIRGCGTLPHVGEHPGTLMLIAFLLMGALAGEKGGWRGCIIGAAVMALFIGPIFLWGAYDRANLSDQLEAERKGGA